MDNIINKSYASVKSNIINEVVTPENVDYLRIYLFTNLDAFTRHPSNRELDNKLVKTYCKSMLEGASDNLIGEMTIDVKTYQIYDGQHRIEAYKLASKKGFNRPLRVKFINAPESLDEQRKLINDINNGKHWDVYDHIHSHIDGNNDLDRLQTFCLNHPRLFRVKKTGKDKGTISKIFYRRGAAIVTGDQNYYKKALKDGTFKAKEDDWNDAEDVYNEVMRILDATKLSNQTDIPAIEGIINGWYKVRNNIKQVNKINKLPHKMDDVFEEMQRMDTRHTTKPDIWQGRFEAVIENAYSRLA